MAGFETIVRPAVVPNIRPSPAQKVVAFDDPGQGFAIIHGNPAKQLNLTTTTSISISRNNGQEVERRVDQVRIYQVDEQGNINKSNFVDVEVANRLRVKDPTGRVTTYYRPTPTADNIELLKPDIIYNTPAGGNL
jgi:hypothetical protein